MGKNFVHLHVHADTSILDGFSKLPEYIQIVKELGQPGLGLSDHGNVSSVYTLIKEARKAGITPVPGSEMYVAPQNPEGAKAKRPVFYGKGGQKAAEYDVSSNGAYTHQTLWAINNEGLKNLFKLSTLSYDPERVYQKPRIDFDLLAEHSEGLVIATGCPSSEISTRFLLGQDDKAYEYAGRLKEIFGDRMFVEIMDHSMKIPLERLLLPKQMELSKKLGIPLLATNDAHYANQHDSIHHEELLAAQSGSRMSDLTFDEGGSRFAFEGNEYYIKSTEQMVEIFPEEDYPGAISNTLVIAEMAQDVSFNYDPTLRPIAKVPEGHDQVSYFKELINIGFKERYGNSPKDVKDEALKRIAEEFEVIHSSDFVGYFLTVYEYLMWTREKYSTRDESGDIIALSLGVGRGCFEPGSLITTGKGGHKAIEKIRIGEKVRTHDTTYQEVEDIFIYDVVDENMIELELSNGRTIKCTSDHMIFHETQGFVQANNLKIGDILLGSKKRRELSEYKCGSCEKTIITDKQTFDKVSAKGYYKPKGEYWCYDCVKNNLHAIPEVKEGSLKGSMRSKEKAIKEKNAAAVKKHWAENREWRLDRWRNFAGTKEYSINCTERNLRRYSDPEKLEKLIKQGHGNYKSGYFISHRQNEKEIYFASSYEQKALNIFETDSNVIAFDRSGLRIHYLKSETGLMHNYLPDFYVEYSDGTKKIIEIKAKWQASETETVEKLIQAREHIEKMGYKFEVWTEKELEDRNDVWHNRFEVTNIKRYKYTGKVYDLQVANVHNYTVSDVTVHNSVGGSIIAYLLKISELDPIKHDLLFERFLSAGRGDTYRIEYDDGTFEDVIVSEKRFKNGEGLYIHELKKGDVLEFDIDPTVSNDENSPKQPEIKDKPINDKTTTPSKDKVETPSKTVSKTSKYVENIVEGDGFEEHELSDLSAIGF